MKIHKRVPLIDAQALQNLRAQVGECKEIGQGSGQFLIKVTPKMIDYVRKYLDSKLGTDHYTMSYVPTLVIYEIVFDIYPKELAVTK